MSRFMLSLLLVGGLFFAPGCGEDDDAPDGSVADGQSDGTSDAGADGDVDDGGMDGDVDDGGMDGDVDDGGMDGDVDDGGIDGDVDDGGMDGDVDDGSSDAGDGDDGGDGDVDLYPVPGSWDQATTISPTNGIHADSAPMMPQVAMNDNGDALISWYQGTSLFYSQRTSGTWAHPVDVDDHAPMEIGGAVSVPAPGIANNGDAAIAYGLNINNAKVFQSTRSGGTWTHPTSVDDRVDFDGTVSTNVRLKMAPDGSGIMAWTTSPSSIYGVVGAAGGWTFPQYPVEDRINVGGALSNANEKLEVGVGNNGNSVVAWRHNDGAGEYIQIAHHENDTWTKGIQSGTPNGTYVQQPPAVAVGANGDAIVAYVQDVVWDDCNYCQGLYVSEYTNGAWTHPADSNDIFSPATNLSGTVEGDEIHVGVADNGDAVVIWRQRVKGEDCLPNSTCLEIYVAERTAGVWNKPTSHDFIPLPDVSPFAFGFTAATAPNGDVIMIRAGKDVEQPYNKVYVVWRIAGQWYIPTSYVDLVPLGISLNDPMVALSSGGYAVMIAISNDADAGHSRIWMNEFFPD